MKDLAQMQSDCITKLRENECLFCIEIPDGHCSYYKNNDKCAFRSKLPELRKRFETEPLASLLK